MAIARLGSGSELTNHEYCWKGVIEMCCFTLLEYMLGCDCAAAPLLESSRFSLIYKVVDSNSLR